MLFILIFLAGLLCSFLIPVWWSIVPVAYFLSFFSGTGTRSPFWMGFLANSLLWALLITVKMVRNNTILADRSAHFLRLPNWICLLLVTVLIGGLAGGLSSYCGYQVRKIIRHPSKDLAA